MRLVFVVVLLLSQLLSIQLRDGYGQRNSFRDTFATQYFGLKEIEQTQRQNVSTIRHMWRIAGGGRHRKGWDYIIRLSIFVPDDDV